MKNKTIKKKSSILLGLLVLLFISIVVYFLSRSIFLIYAQYGRLEKILAILFFLSEGFIMFHAFGFFGNIYKLSKEKEELPPQSELNDFPPVAILIPARHEPREVIEDTLISCYNLAYPKITIYLLDDSSEQKYKDEADELVKKYNAKIFRRKERHGAKAGIINDCVKSLDDKYVVVFDCDQNPLPMFLSKLIPIMEADPKLAFVQTPQFYSNAASNRIAFGANMQQAVFYEYVCEAKSSSQAMICCGTNVVIRREALLDVGGLDESTVTEDFATSLAMHLKGWKSLYTNHVYTFGMGPEDLGAYFKQQARWARGNVGVLRKVVGQMFRHPCSLNISQWWEYSVTGSYYLIGWAYLFLILCPVVFLFFNVPSFFMSPVVYTFTFFPYLLLSMAIYYTSMRSRNYSIGQLLKGQLLSFITLPVYMKASALGLLGIKGTFAITAKGENNTIPYSVLWPQLLFWALNLSAVTWGVNRFIYEQTTAVLMNVLWAGYHCVLLSSVFFYNENK